MQGLPKRGDQRANPLPTLRRETPADAAGPAQIGLSRSTDGMSNNSSRQAARHITADQ